MWLTAQSIRLEVMRYPRSKSGATEVAAVLATFHSHTTAAGLLVRYNMNSRLILDSILVTKMGDPDFRFVRGSPSTTTQY